jgi:hypothetical protein
MVSTRQGVTKFSVGETVLCYEPDETKAKVLYESKVCGVIFSFGHATCSLLNINGGNMSNKLMNKDRTF